MLAIIRSVEEYNKALTRVESLARTDPPVDSGEGLELGVLAVLLEDYERRVFPLESPGPLDALRFRMEQRGLTPKDLVPFLGSRSRVSEVLSGKRPLSLGMIRALHAGLGIPLAALVAEQESTLEEGPFDWERFPLKEMLRRGWLGDRFQAAAKRLSFAETRELVEGFFRPLGGVEAVAGVLHKTDVVRTARSADPFALAAWAAFVLRQADTIDVGTEFSAVDWKSDLLRELRGLSRFDVGPRLAVQFLQDHGVAVVVEPHLKRTRLDGAAMLRRDGTPVIGLTIRHDRVDNFWHTLFHELMHILLHLSSPNRTDDRKQVFLDDLEVVSDMSVEEREADEGAQEALIPQRAWDVSAAQFVVAPITVKELARELGVSPAIVAGRVRHERRNYRLLSSMVGAGEVRKYFEHVQWPKDS